MQILHACLLAVCSGCALGPGALPSGQQPGAAAPEAAEAEAWTGWAAFNYYYLRDDADYGVPVVALDRGALHFEARHNYEDRDTSSLWGGWNFAVEDAVSVEATAMVGAVFGDTDGVAPGYRLTLSTGAVEFTSEGEYLIDLDDHHDNFYYSWSELSVGAGDWLRIGAVGQRTRVFDSPRELDFGLLLGVGEAPWSITAYAFEPWDDDRFFVFAAELIF